MPDEDYESKITKDHDVIQQWAQERGGKPASVKTTGSDEDAGILRINFPGFADEGLEEIDWYEWFSEFDDKDLDFLYQEKTKDGGLSRFFKLIRK